MRSLKNALIGLCLILWLGVSGCQHDEDLPEAARQLVLNTVDGNKRPIAAGEGPLLVYFWSTSCVICIEDMPELVQLYQRYQPAGFDLVAISMPYDAPNTVVEFNERLQLPFTVALDIAGQALESFATVKGTPTYYLLDGQRQLVKRFIGRTPTGKLEQQIERALGEDWPT